MLEVVEWLKVPVVEVMDECWKGKTAQDDWVSKMLVLHYRHSTLTG